MFNNNTLEKFSLKYSNKVPEGYDTSKIEFTYDFINLVLKHDKSIDDAVKSVAKDYNLSDEYLMDYLIENRYILNKTKKEDFSKQLKTYNTKSLKKILKKHNLKTSGKRTQIEQRIFKNNLLGTNYVLSSKSKIFFKNKKRRVNIFNEYLFDYYYFDEFNDFYMKNYRKKKAKIPIEFINQHINKSFADKNHNNFIFNNEIMAKHFYIKENYKTMLEYVLKTFCMNLNPIWKIDDLKNHVGILLDTYDSILFLNEKMGKNRIISAYYVIWDSYNFERIIVPKFEGYRYLKDILNSKNYDKLNNDLDKKYFSNENLKIKRITQKTLFDF